MDQSVPMTDTPWPWLTAVGVILAIGLWIVFSGRKKP